MPATFFPFQRKGTGEWELPLLPPMFLPAQVKPASLEAHCERGRGDNPAALSCLTVPPDSQVGLPGEKLECNGGWGSIWVRITKGLYKS